MSERYNSSLQRGMVNFPLHKASSGEGGVFVRLVVVDAGNEEDKGWHVCCTAGISVGWTETFLGDDVHGLRQCEDVTSHPHFPDLYSEKLSPEERYRSIPYLTVLDIGSTGWAPMDEWYCTYADLTEEGKVLYHALKRLYHPNGTLYLQTWLDT